jgi:putative thioredoxin
MSNPSNLNLSGVVDLGALAAAKAAQASSEALKASTPAGTIVDVTEGTFDVEVMERSTKNPVVVSFGDIGSAASVQLSPVLEKLVAEYGGRITLAKIEANANPRLAQAFNLQAIPSVFLVINGQVQPIFQGAQPEAQIRPVFEKILEVAEQMGLKASADVEAEATQDVPVEPPLDPKYEKAFAAMERQDWDSARSAFQELLAVNPADDDAKAGLIQASILERALGLDFAKVLAAPISNLEDLLLHADVLLLSGEMQKAFDVLIAEIPTSDAETKNQLRDRVLDYFVLAGDVEEVRTARRRLTNALY